MAANCECGSGIERTPHYYAGKFIDMDCPKCFRKNDDAHTKTLMTPDEWQRWLKRIGAVELPSGELRRK